MTVHEAANPRHTRVIDTTDAWWLADAWNGRTFDWIASDTEANMLRGVLNGLTYITRANLREALPDATWLAKLTETCFPGLPPVRDAWKRLPYEAQVALAAESWCLQNQEGENITSLRSAAHHIMSVIPVTDDLLDPDVLFSKTPLSGVAGNWALKYTDLTGVATAKPGRGKFMSEFLLGLAGNPGLPASKKPANPDTNMTTYRWMMSMALLGSGSDYQGKEFLQSLLRNPGATQEDFEFFLGVLDQTEADVDQRKKAKRARYDMASFYKLRPLPSSESIATFREIVAQHPNFVSWPSVDEAYPVDRELVPSWKEGMAATVDLPTNLFEEALIGSLLRGNPLKPRDTQEFVVRLLIDGNSKELVRGRMLGHLRTFLRREVSATSLEESLRTLGLFAVTLGAVFRELDDELGTENVPFDWFKEML